MESLTYCCNCTSTTAWSAVSKTDDTNYYDRCSCTCTGDKEKDDEYIHQEEREEHNLINLELSKLCWRIKDKPKVSIIPINIINKTMQRRMMNGRR